MILDPNRYTASYPFIKRLYERAVETDTKEQAEIISELSLASMVPVLAIVLFVQREFGTNPSLELSAKNLIAFYHYDNVVPLE